jgi:hypothetical protein
MSHALARLKADCLRTPAEWDALRPSESLFPEYTKASASYGQQFVDLAAAMAVADGLAHWCLSQDCPYDAACCWYLDRLNACAQR